MDDAAGTWWDSPSLEELENEIVAESDAGADAFLRERWLSTVMAVLRDARRSAGLTQHELAERLGTRQPAVSRLEHDEDTTLGRFVDYLIACGKLPSDISTVALGDERMRVRSQPAPTVATADFPAVVPTSDARSA